MKGFERLRDLIENKLNLNQTEFAEKVGVTNQYIYLYTSGKRNLGRIFLNKIKKAFPEVNTDYLLYGKGEPIDSQGFKFDVTQVKDAEVQYLNQQLSLFKAENKILRERIELLENKN
jgi:transcriptional regulator with XRE-family HTH domain